MHQKWKRRRRLDGEAKWRTERENGGRCDRVLEKKKLDDG